MYFLNIHLLSMFCFTRFQYVVVLILFLVSCISDTRLYYNQTPPIHKPELFAPGIVNTDSIELNVVFNKTFTEMFFSRIVNGSFVIYHTELAKGDWTAPKPIQMYPDSVQLSVACDPTITDNGDVMYFLGVDPEGYNEDTPIESLYRIPPDIYKSVKVNNQWQLATKVDHPVSTDYFESYPIVVTDGSLYFQSDRPGGAGGRDTYRAQLSTNQSFATPESISLNTSENAASTYINPNEDILIASSREGFQISIKKEGQWQPPKIIDLPYEEGWVYYCPYISPDGQYFFYSRRFYGSSKRGWAGVTRGEVYWVSTKVIDGMYPGR